MRWLVALAVAAALATAAVVLLRDGDRSGPTTLRVASTAPLTVEGRGFAPDEAVRLNVTGGGRTHDRELEADQEGSFRATIPEAGFDPCGGLRVSATGAEGSRASAKLPQPLCPP
jgi:hypothetical protein